MGFLPLDYATTVFIWDATRDQVQSLPISDVTVIFPYVRADGKATQAYMAYRFGPPAEIPSVEIGVLTVEQIDFKKVKTIRIFELLHSRVVELTKGT